MLNAGGRGAASIVGTAKGTITGAIADREGPIVDGAETFLDNDALPDAPTAGGKDRGTDVFGAGLPGPETIAPPAEGKEELLLLTGFDCS